MRPIVSFLAVCFAGILFSSYISGPIASCAPAQKSARNPSRLEELQKYHIASVILEKEEATLREVTGRNKSEKQAMLNNFVRKTLTKDLRDIWDRDHDNKLSYEWVNKMATLPEAEHRAVVEKEETDRKALVQRVKYMQSTLNDPTSANGILYKVAVDELSSSKQRHDQTQFVSRLRRDRDEARAALMQD